MSSNATPDNRPVLTALGGKILEGQKSIGAAVGLHHHTAATLAPILYKLTGDPEAAEGSAAFKGSQFLYRECVAATGDAEAELLDLSKGPVKQWLEGYKKVIEGIHGKKANDGWVAAGFGTGTTAIPEKHDARHALLNAARLYLGSHASYETSLPQKDGPALAITSAQALALHGQMTAKFSLINARSTEQAECKQARDADVKALYKEVSATIAELRDLLSDTDPRWETFGLNIPARPNPPEGGTGLKLSAAGAGRVLVVWEYAVRAEYYRLFLQRMGVDAEPVNIADPQDLEYTIKDLAAGTVIRVYIIPANAGGEGPRSAVAEWTV